jgi:hypothetical protein
VSLELTESGIALLESADTAVNGRLEQIAAGLGAKAGERAIASLGRWHDAMLIHRAARANK